MQVVEKLMGAGGGGGGLFAVKVKYISG